MASVGKNYVFVRQFVSHRCKEVKEPIMDRFVVRVRVHPNYKFHPACLSCGSCHATLDVKLFHLNIC